MRFRAPFWLFYGKMSAPNSQTFLKYLLDTPRETERVEFKVNDFKPEDIGEYISALSNSAALLHEEAAFIVWGVEDATRSVVGTKFKPHEQKVGNEDLEPWLNRHLFPAVHFVIHEFVVDAKDVIVFEIQPCVHTPVRWKEHSFIRVGSYKKKLRDYAEKERALWARLSQATFERGFAQSGLTDADVLDRLECAAYFEMLGGTAGDFAIRNAPAARV